MSIVTLKKLKKMKQAGDKITMLTAYDASFARLLDQQKIDVILVGDSLGMVMQGHDSTIPVTMDDMVYHSKMVSPECKYSLVLSDLPFMSCTSPVQAIKNATRLMQEGGAHMVKMEGGESQAENVKQLARHGVPLCAHLGLQPQSVHKLGGYFVQGRAVEIADKMIEDALLLQDAGADMVLIECVPVALANRLTQALEVPVIGIGAGRSCDGQVLVLQDMLGISKKAPRFSQDFLTGQSEGISGAVATYIDQVKTGAFPSDEQCFL
ncbi:MAG: 3-methyl-2-oxobutanoate hydroxymethyltransferase [Cocleimonas sp.]|nr:3-methyl-2-oxobutanoate hydroxymethyltransferase [Cocleimonas sp.]